MATENKTPRLSRENTILVVLDLQEKLMPSIRGYYEITEANKKLITGIGILGIKGIFTQQYTKGLGMTISDIVDSAQALTDECYDDVLSAVENPLALQSAWEFEYIEKNTFSAYAEPAFRTALAEVEKKEDGDIPVSFPGKKNKQVILSGVEAHICVLQTALDFIAAGYDVFIAADAVSSRHEDDMKYAINRLRDAGAVITTVESILFELLRNAALPEFKQISALVK